MRPGQTSMNPAVALDRVTKRFGATVALSDATFSIGQGAVHAILGENGAGKSTLVKILSGIVQPDSGTIRVFGREEVLDSRQRSSRVGLETAFQEIPLVPDLTVGQNLLLPDQPLRFGLFQDGREARRRVDRILADLDLPDIDPRLEVRDLDLALRQKVEIARAISRAPRILILDEPTAALSRRDVAWLGQRIRALRATQTTVVLVTHRMQEVREFCGSFSILRNGTHVGSFRADEVSDDEVFSLIMGRSVDVAFPARSPRQVARKSAPALAARHLCVGDRLADVGLDLWPGEIVGVAALQGMGQLDLFNALFGVQPLDRGTIERDGRPIRLACPRDAIDAGIGLVPEDRKIQGLALKQTGLQNASLPTLQAFSTLGWIDLERERRSADAEFKKVQLHPRALYKAAASFSGGNQQKIVLAKWLMTRCKVLLVYDPTRGVDIGTKHEIYQLLRAFADAGGTVLFHSTETQELIGLSDRILVLYRGRISAELTEALSEERVGAHMLGAEPTARRAVSHEAAQ